MKVEIGKLYYHYDKTSKSKDKILILIISSFIDSYGYYFYNYYLLAGKERSPTRRFNEGSYFSQCLKEAI